MSSVIVDISLPSEAVERCAGHDDTGGVDVGGTIMMKVIMIY